MLLTAGQGLWAIWQYRADAEARLLSEAGRTAAYEGASREGGREPVGDCRQAGNYRLEAVQAERNHAQDDSPSGANS